MTALKVNRIKAYLDKSFAGKIDLSDIQKKPPEEIQKNFLSRALASYALIVQTGVEIEEAAKAVTDGFEDNGIDAIYFDRTAKNLWLVQSKFIHSGIGGVDNGEVEKFAKGVKLLIESEFGRFNDKVKLRENEITEALNDASVKIQILFGYTGKELSRHNLQSIRDLQDDINDPDELIIFHDFNIDKAYRGLEAGLSAAPIEEDISLANWGHIEDPLKSFYGQISGTELAALWKKYGRRLFNENIRNFLGNSGANDDIINTVKSEPQNFIYFNNGITILCEKIKRKPIGGSDRAVGIFTCNGLAVVNGAQTLGSLGSLSETNPDELNKIKVLVKCISLEGSVLGFGKRITVATNTQNRVEKKDFISLETEQARLGLELRLEGITYHFKRTDEKVIADDSNYLLEEVAFSQASFSNNVDYSTMVKKESGKLWEDVSKQPYTDIFNLNLTALKVKKVLLIYRFISNKMRQLTNGVSGKERSIYLYGNAFVAHIIYQQMPKALWADDNKNFEEYFDNQLEQLVDSTISDLVTNIEKTYPDSMIVYILRNYTKCRVLKTLMV